MGHRGLYHLLRSLPLFPFHHLGELPSLNEFGVNDAEIAVDDTEVEGTIIARRSNPTTGAEGGAVAETGAGGPVPVDGPIL